ncbi:pyridoxamine 5'-phosphate oxidase family protein [Streptomyces sp. NPDC050147]|uniref:pyridoxamine 5'-phosphate oxidase family protein n=1 Tax=Streptomyces sp. NPDC050147 TaxID=3155513 RepID=UPI0034336297
MTSVEPGAASEELAARTLRLLGATRYLTLATSSPQGEPWSAALHYEWQPDPLRLLFCSSHQTRHGADIASNAQVAGSLFVTGTTTDVAIAPVEGAQFTGVCAEVPDDGLQEAHRRFFEAVFPDPEVRAEWALPLDAFGPPGVHRLYRVTVDRWWLIDLRTWAEDKIDRRVEMPLSALAGAGAR